jgi:chromosomal replication initiation ATPase DnaA
MDTIPSQEQVAATVAAHWSFSLADLRSSSRCMPLAEVRHLAAWMMREVRHDSLESIAQFLGRKSHCTIINSFRYITAKMLKSDRFRLHAQNIRDVLQPYRAEEPIRATAGGEYK